MSACVGGVCRYDVKEDEGWGNKKKFQLVQLQRLFKYRISKNFDIFQKQCTVIPTEAVYI